ncbi:hypothetical protein, partial [Burkholderia pseudomallei]|uniref:hypothetical protein n=1 Tax=Burkholderia pseudomallei TaxID=28450 RepID=UPI001CC2E0BD
CSIPLRPTPAMPDRFADDGQRYRPAAAARRRYPREPLRRRLRLRRLPLHRHHRRLPLRDAGRYGGGDAMRARSSRCPFTALIASC